MYRYVLQATINMQTQTDRQGDKQEYKQRMDQGDTKQLNTEPLATRSTYRVL